MGCWTRSPGVTFVDLDGDGKRDVLVAKDSLLYFHKNVGPDPSIENIKFADGVAGQGKRRPSLMVPTARFDRADIDSDGDFDLFCGSQHGHIYWFENVGARRIPCSRQAGRLSSSNTWTPIPA